MAVLLSLVSGCGAKTGLRAGPVDAGQRVDAAPRDGDLSDHDADDAGGALPSIGRLTPIDPSSTTGCTDSTRTSAFLLNERGVILQFFPGPRSRFRELPPLPCMPRTRGARVASLAVDRDARGLVLYDDGELFRIVADDPNRCPVPGCDNACIPVDGWTPRTDGLRVFSMAFVARGGADALLVAGSTAPSELAQLTIPAFEPRPITTLAPPVAAPSLAATGGGQLFGFFALGTGSSIVEIEPTSGVLLARTDLPGLSIETAGVIVPFGGDLYLFVDGGDGSSELLVFHPSTGSLEDLGGLTGRVVSGAVSVCAPQG